MFDLPILGSLPDLPCKGGSVVVGERQVVTTIQRWWRPPLCDEGGMRWGRGIGDLGIALFPLNYLMYFSSLPNPSKK